MKQIQRLVKTFAPSHYDVTLKINDKDLSFSGTVEITGKVLKETKKITVHANELSMNKVVLGNEELAVGEESSHQEVDLIAKSDIPSGEHTLRIEYGGKINDSMTGIYGSKYMQDSKEGVIFATQFEAHHAREAIPCIDEPAAKATFTLTLETDESYQHVSNTLAETESVSNGVKTTTFKKTPKMSTYLLAFACGEMQSIEAKTANGTLVRCFSSPAQPVKNLKYALQEGVDTLEFFEEYFDTPYPLEKCDHIALPDFDSGAMENWGMITYREIALLADPDNRSVSSEQYVSLVVAHEVSHQWFGNLVTMEWWDDLWLNESFASLMEHIALDKLHPDWQQWEHYTSMDVISTTNRDIFKDIQPVSVEVNDPALIESLFDPGIVYAKGGRLLKMLREYIGDDNFQAGLKSYFKKFAYANASRDDLWTELGNASTQNVKELMDAWILQPGMPVLDVTLADHSLDISQQRFTVDNSDDDTLWPIPLLASADIEPNLIVSGEATVKFKSSQPPILNEHASGHFFVNYKTPEHQKAIADAVSSKDLGAEARINVLNDMLLLSRGGQSNLIPALELATSMQNEDRFSVWALISRILSTSLQMTEGDEEAKKLHNKHKSSVAKNLYEQLGWEDDQDDDANTKQLRSMAVAMMLGADDQAALQKARDLVETVEKLEDLPAEMRASILGSLVRNGDLDLGDKLIDLYQNTDPEMQLDITMALASTKNADFAKKTIHAGIGKDGFVRPQDLMRWIAYFLRNHHTRGIAWDFMETEWEMLEDTLKKSKSFDFLPVYAAQVVSTQEWADKYSEFFKPHLENLVLKRNITIGLADIEARVAWRDREEPLVKSWLEKNVE